MTPKPHLPLAYVTAAFLLAACGSDSDRLADPSLIHMVQRGDLSVSVRERAELKAASDTRITSQLEGRATLIYLIPEGSVVEKGERVAELDTSDTAEKRANQAILVADAKSAWDQARKKVEIVEQELQAAENEAESRLAIATIRREKFLGQPRSLARQVPADEPTEAAACRPEVEAEPATEAAAGPQEPADPAAGTNREMLHKLADLLEAAMQNNAVANAKYDDLDVRARELLGDTANLDLEMGEMANQILQQIDEINLAHADLEMAADTLFHSRRLQEKNFITRNELERHEISHKRSRSQLTLAWNNLQLLIKYTLRETLITLQQEIDNSRLMLASVRGTSEARRVSERAELERSEAWYHLAKERLDNYDSQLENAVIVAPTGGLVVYGRYDWDEPVYEGMDVREGQDVVILPHVATMIAELKVHEAQIDKVGLGQEADVRVDAFPDEAFTGRVTRVSTLPVPTRRSTDPKVYLVRVEIQDDNSSGRLRPGMNATVVIDVGVFTDVLNVPVPAVKRHEDNHYVWRIDGSEIEPVRVTLGRNNLTHVEVLEGLAAGDRVLLVPPSEPPTGADESAAEPR